MKIKTRDGEVELTPEMVRRGMVFRGDRADLMATTDGRETGPRSMVYEARNGVRVKGCFTERILFLGCNLEHASREDCEVYGVAPGIDAGAHGFARLREGGAVDFRRETLPTGAIVYSHPDGRSALVWCEYAPPRPLLRSERFIGLDVRRARPEDVERLCCGTRETADRFDPETGTYLPARWCRCTLAIGDHDYHEDLATGARWPAKDATTPERVWSAEGMSIGAIQSLSGTLGFTTSTGNGFRFEDDGGRLRPTAGRGEVGTREKIDVYTFNRSPLIEPPTSTRLLFFDVADELKTLATLHSDGTFSCACGSADPAEHRDGCALPWQYRYAAAAASNVQHAGGGCSGTAAWALRGAAAVTFVAWCLSAEGYREKARIAHEAPLVALVNAVPEGLDPIGWRAAVLAFAEEAPPNSPLRRGMIDRGDDVARGMAAVLRGEAVGGKSYEHVIAAYRRAIPPHSAPPHERLTWKRRGPILTVDDGRDD